MLLALLTAVTIQTAQPGNLEGRFSNVLPEPSMTTQLQILPPKPNRPVPTPRQLAWQQNEYYAFVHFGPNTFTGKEWGTGKEPTEIFNPKHLDCLQWCKAFKKAGMAGVIITAKHHDGFCLWPSKYSVHTVAQSPWKAGKGDVLKELSDACHKIGLKFGVYLSPWDRNHPAYGTPEYNQVFMNMLGEVLTKYGKVFEVWFDGANGEGPNGKRQVYDWPAFNNTVRKWQPDAVIFSDAGPDIRWVGNEEGFAGETNWSTITRSDYKPGTDRYKELTEGNPDGEDWVPAECDVSIRPGWFYRATEDAKVKSPAVLEDLYEKSVGRNGSFLLNVPAGPDGKIHQQDIDSLLGLQKRLDSTYKRNLARGSQTSVEEEIFGSQRGGEPDRDAKLRQNGAPAKAVDGNPNTFWATKPGMTLSSLTINLAKPTEIDRVVLQEAIQYGQRVGEFNVAGKVDGAWVHLAKGTTIGHKRILKFKPVKVSAVQLNIRFMTGTVAISEVGLYLAPPTVP